MRNLVYVPVFLVKQVKNTASFLNKMQDRRQAHFLPKINRKYPELFFEKVLTSRE